MKRLVTIILILTSIFIPLWHLLAEVVCTKDAFGDVVCKDKKINKQWKQQKDAFGRESWIDKEGNKYEKKTDAFGNMMYKDSKGNTYYEKTDAFGNTIIKDDKGKDIFKCTTNAFGDYVCR